MSKVRMNFELTTETVTVQRVRDTDEGREVLESHEFPIADIPAVLEDGDLAPKSLAAYGLSKLLQDRTSNEGPEGKIAAMQAVFATLAEGKYRVRKEPTGGGKRVSIDTFFAMAVAEFLTEQSGKSVDIGTATLFLERHSAEDRKALKAHDAIGPRIEELKAKAAEEADSLGDLFK